MKCPDCKGSGEYRGFNIAPEPCRKCGGTGELNADGTTSTAGIKAKALDDLFKANKLPDWMKDYTDEIDLSEALRSPAQRILDPATRPKEFSIDLERLKEMLRNNPGTLQLDPGTKIPELKVGDTVHFYDAGWYEAKVVKIYNSGPNGSPPNVEWVRAEYTCGAFNTFLWDVCWNVTQGRWEYIRSGTPVWP